MIAPASTHGDRAACGNRAGFGRAVVGGLALAAATPPAWFPGAEAAVVLGLAAWASIATHAARPWWTSYLLGVLHMACFSWSVRHVMFGAYAAIVLLGGLYFVFGTALVRAAAPRHRVWVFALAVATAFWARSGMPGLEYPHGQPCHVLYATPTLLWPVVVGGEPLANALLGGLAAALLELYRGWRLAVPTLRVGGGLVAGMLVSWGLCLSLGGWLRSLRPTADDRLAVAAIEPRVHPILDGPDDATWSTWYDEQVKARLLRPTQALLREPLPPDLVLWPESALRGVLPADAIGPEGVAVLPKLGAAACRLVVGAQVAAGAPTDGTPRPTTPAAILIDPATGRALARQDKRHLVPGGERIPFLHLLPAGWALQLRETFAAALASLPDHAAGTELPPLRTAAGVPFGALLCFDNAFPGPAAAQVAAGARLLVVLSNECWYRGGGELSQLVAMTVVRALETATPVVRCTQDGWTVAVGADGHRIASLPPPAGPQPAPGILRVDVPLGSGRLPPMAWWRANAGWCALVGLLLAAAHGRWRRATL